MLKSLTCFEIYPFKKKRDRHRFHQKLKYKDTVLFLSISAMSNFDIYKKHRFLQNEYFGRQNNLFIHNFEYKTVCHRENYNMLKTIYKKAYGL